MKFFKLILIVVLITPFVQAQKLAPRVVSMTPAHGAQNVKPTTTKIIVEFDRPMNTQGYSFVGGGTKFPKIPAGARPTWVNPTTCVLPVELKPDHAYRLGLNSQRFTKFQSADGVPLVPVIWQFTTLPAKQLSPDEQTKLNVDALANLRDHIREEYSYYDYRKLVWTSLEQKHKESIVEAKSTREWISAVASMLAPVGDLHLYFRFGDEVFPTATQAVAPLFDRRGLRPYLKTVEQIERSAAAGRTQDGYGYLLIGTWIKKSMDLAGIERALVGMKDCQGIIIDVRVNSGGDERIAKQIASYFIKGEHVYAKHRTRKGNGAKKLKETSDRRIVGLKNKDRLDMPVVVLTSPMVMSSCEAFVLMMKQAPDCTIVGQRTRGSSGNPKPFTLANGVTVLIPSWIALDAKGKCFEGVGIAPDIEVKAIQADFAADDPILKRAIKVLQDKNKEKTE